MEAELDINLNRLYKLSAAQEFEVGSLYYATLARFVDPHDFYLIPYHFLPYMPALNRAGRRFALHELKVNASVIFLSQRPDVNKYLKPFDTNAVRGTILNIDNDNNCLIQAKDLGFYEENVPIQRLFHPQYQVLLDIQSVTQHCELELCVPIGRTFSDSANKACTLFMENIKLKVVVQGKHIDRFRVTVYNETPGDLATLLALSRICRLL